MFWLVVAEYGHVSLHTFNITLGLFDWWIREASTPVNTEAYKSKEIDWVAIFELDKMVWYITKLSLYGYKISK